MPSRRKCAAQFAMLVTCVSAAAFAQPEAPLIDVIPSGQEALISEMLGRGAELPGGCHWDGASIDPTHIESRYVCASGNVRLDVLPVARAPAGSIRTLRFAIAPPREAAPPELVASVADRIRAREASFHFTRAIDRPRSNVSHPHRRVRWLVAALVLLLAAAGVTIGLRRRGTPRAPPSPELLRFARSPYTTAGASLTLLVAAHATLGGIGMAIRALLTHRPGPGVPAALALLLVALVVGTCASLILYLGPRRRALLIMLGLVAIDAGRYVHGLPPRDTTRFGTLVVYPPYRVTHDMVLGRSVTYGINAMGFRGPDFSLSKTPATRRIVIIGDSFVFGIGVDTDETLSAQLTREIAARNPSEHFEVLNLGIPGDNLASHVTVYDEAMARLSPDVVVLHLTLPNDLGHWDFQSERAEAVRVSPFSVAQYLLGEYAAIALWDRVLLETDTTPAGLRELDAATEHLVRVRRDPNRSPPLLFFASGSFDDDLRSRLERVPNATILTATFEPNEHIPGDGHPNAAGNLRTARIIANALEAAGP